MDNGVQTPKTNHAQPGNATQATPPQDSHLPAQSEAQIAPEKDKPKNWKASLTMAQIKILQAEEAIKKHNERFPPKTTATPKKDAPAGNVNKAKATADTKTNDNMKSAIPAGITNKAKPTPAAGTTKEAKLTTMAHNGGNATPASNFTTVARKTKVKQPADLKFQRAPPPCGLPGCPVLADHERRPYVFDEPNRPNYVKKIQAKGDAATNDEWDNVDNFFNAHRFAK